MASGSTISLNKVFFASIAIYSQKPTRTTLLESVSVIRIASGALGANPPIRKLKVGPLVKLMVPGVLGAPDVPAVPSVHVPLKL
jgi:hypothetical protein